MKRITFALLSLVLLLAVLPGLAAAAGYEESFNLTGTFVNTTSFTSGATTTGGGAQNMTITFHQIDKIGTPSRLFWSSNGDYQPGMLDVEDIANESKTTTVDFYNSANNTWFGNGQVSYQINWVSGTTTVDFLTAWIDVYSWNPSLIGSPTGLYTVTLRYDMSAINMLNPATRGNNGEPTQMQHNLGWDFTYKQGANFLYSRATSGPAYFVVYQGDQTWNSYLITDFSPGYTDVQLLRSGYYSDFNVSTDLKVYHASYSASDIITPFEIRAYESPVRINITAPNGQSFIRNIINSESVSDVSYTLQLDKSSVQLFENVTGTLEYIGPSPDPADQIEYQTPGAIVRDTFKKIGSSWYHYNQATSNWDLTTAADAYSGTINFPSSSFHEGESRTFDCYIHQGNTVLQEFHLPITLTSSAGWVTISFEARDLATGYLIPYSNLNLTLRSSGTTIQYNLGVTGKKYLTLPRNSQYGFNITHQDYSYPVIRDSSGNLIPWYGLYTDTDKETVTYLTRTLAAGVNKTNVIFKVTDGLTGWDRPAAWVTLKDQNEVALSVAQTNDYGIYTFMGLDTNRTYRYAVDSPGYSPAGGSFNAGANQSYTVNVVLYQVPATTLPAGVTTIPTATPDYQNSQEARDAAVWDGLNFVYANIGMFMKLGFIVALLGLIAMMSGKRRR